MSKYEPNTFWELFDDSFEYPSSQLLEGRGLAPNTVYNYISTTFLNGWINYPKIIKAVMKERYCNWDIPQVFLEIEDVIQKLNTVIHADWSKGPDDVHILSESDTDYWYFWYDRDCSDSSIGTLDKNKYSRELVLNLFEKYISSNNRGIQENGKETSRYIEFKPRGWIGG